MKRILNQIMQKIKKNIIPITIVLILFIIFIIYILSYFFKPYKVDKNFSKLDLENVNKIMIVAHPDDEILWGGAHLLEDDYLVVCITCGTVKERVNEFVSVMNETNDKYIMLGYPDKTNGERDNWDSVYNDISKDIGKSFKWISIISVAIFIIVFCFIIIGIVSVFTRKESSSNFFDNIKSSSEYLTNIDDISNFDYNFLDTHSRIAIATEDNSTFYFSKKGNDSRELIYLLYNDSGNKLIPIYKSVYSDGETTYILYVPVIYENIKISHDSIANSISNAKVSAPKYYFNLEHSEYSFGYQDLDKLYEEVIKPLEDNYTITKK